MLDRPWRLLSAPSTCFYVHRTIIPQPPTEHQCCDGKVALPSPDLPGGVKTSRSDARWAAAALVGAASSCHSKHHLAASSPLTLSSECRSVMSSLQSLRLALHPSPTAGSSKFPPFSPPPHVLKAPKEKALPAIPSRATPEDERSGPSGAVRRGTKLVSTDHRIDTRKSMSDRSVINGGHWSRRWTSPGPRVAPSRIRLAAWG